MTRARASRSIAGVPEQPPGPVEPPREAEGAARSPPARGSPGRMENAARERSWAGLLYRVPAPSAERGPLPGAGVDSAPECREESPGVLGDERPCGLDGLAERRRGHLDDAHEERRLVPTAPVRRRGLVRRVGLAEQPRPRGEPEGLERASGPRASSPGRRSSGGSRGRRTRHPAGPAAVAVEDDARLWQARARPSHSSSAGCAFWQCTRTGSPCFRARRAWPSRTRSCRSIGTPGALGPSRPHSPTATAPPAPRRESSRSSAGPSPSSGSSGNSWGWMPSPTWTRRSRPGQREERVPGSRTDGRHQDALDSCRPGAIQDRVTVGVEAGDVQMAVGVDQPVGPRGRER